jgi:hypothetical protein
MTLTLGSETYTGRWLYMSGPGSVSIVNTVATSGAQSASGLGTGVAIPTSGHGSIILSAPDGASLRCVFAYSEWSSSGLGECRDGKGELYDLQITK